MTFLALGFLLASRGQAPPSDLQLVPMPAKLTMATGSFTLPSSAGGGTAGRGTVTVRAPRAARNEANLLCQSLNAATHQPGEFRTRGSAPAGASLTITLKLDPNGSFASEGYSLIVAPDGVTIAAGTTAGLFYGGQTLTQLVMSHTDAIPAVEIEDAPRFGWRGLMLDVSRHFRSKADVERYLDIMAFHKLNVFHWHLVDDGGWRIEIKKYPELTRRGAWRSKPTESWGGPIEFPAAHSDTEYGGFYTQKEVKEVIRYAAERHITIVPEIEMPGHSLAAITSYPDVACTKPDGSGPVVNSNYCPGKEATFKMLTGILDEVIALFPSKFIHIGGDEVDKSTWQACPDCQARIKSEGLKNTDELQSYFIKRIEKYINSKGRRLIGWDEILEGGLAPNATVMSWRGVDGGKEAARQGKNVVMSPTSHCYFDYQYSDISVAKVYTFNPIVEGMDDAQAKLVLGGQGNLWTEWIPTRDHLDEMTWPRAAALAEVLWTPKADQNWANFQTRLPAEYAWLGAMGVHYMTPAKQ